MTITRLIEEINYLNFDPQSSYEAYFKLFNKIDDYPTYTTILKSGSKTLRSRTNLDKVQFRKFSDLGYPPSKLICNYSRANRPHQSFFYSSESAITTYAELLPSWTSLNLKIGDSIEVTTAEFKTTKDFYITIIPDFLNKRMKENLFPNLELTNFEKEILEELNKLLRKDTKADPNIYFKTSAFFNTLRVGFQDIAPTSNGFLFCSVQNKNVEERGWNLVLDPGCFDNFCQVEKVFKRTFTLIDNQNNNLEFETSLERNAKELVFETNEIVW